MEQQHPRVGPSAASAGTTDRSALAGLGVGLAVADEQGALVWCDDTLGEMIDKLPGAARSAPRCCDLLGCATAMEGEDGTCLARAALQRDGGLPPRAATLAVDGTPVTVSAMRVRGAGADGHSPLVVLHVGFDAALDVAEDSPQPPELRVSALGPLRVEVGGELRTGDWLRQRPGELLRYLIAQRGRPAPAEDIAAAVWPDRGPAALSNVRYCAYHLRRQLDGLPPGSSQPSLVVHRDGGYRLAVERLVLDVESFELAVESGLAAYQRGDDARALEELGAALELYRGDFLADEPYAEWALSERDYLHERAARALWAYADLTRRAGRLEEATGCLRRLTELEPFDTDVAQELIAVCLERGRRSEAVRHYRALRLRLRRAFGEQPDFELADLAGRVGGPATRRAAAAA